MSKDIVNYREKAEAMLKNLNKSDAVELLANILEIADTLHTNKLNSYNRSLPLADLFVDRWELAKKLNFGAGTSIYNSCLVLGEVRVGKDTWIGPQVVLDGSGGLQIGDNCSISANVQIYSHDSVAWATSGGTESYAYEATTIGNNCYIGPNVVIAKGVKIGDCSIVGANSFVNKDVKAGTTVVGNPARLVES